MVAWNIDRPASDGGTSGEPGRDGAVPHERRSRDGFDHGARQVAIVAGVRTPMAKAGTALREVHVTELARAVMQETLYRANWLPGRVDEVLMGNVVMPADATNPARVAAIYAGIPARVPAMTIQRNCASGLEAVAEAASRIRMGQSRVVLAGGAESMSTLPLLLPNETVEPMTKLARARNVWQKASAVAALRPRHFKPVAALELGLTDPTCDMIMGKTAEVLAHEWGVTRRQQDEFALRSHQRAAAAEASGRFATERMPFYADGDGAEHAGHPHDHHHHQNGDHGGHHHFHAITTDVGPRANQTLEALAKLKPIFDRRDGTVTVGNSCQVTDGAAALLLMDADVAREEHLPILGFVRAYAVTGLDPARMGLGPVYAMDQLLRQTGLKLSDIPLFEINEAFAAQVIACQRAMISADFCKAQLGRDEPMGEIDEGHLNVNGGAIALGHPVGATGSRLVLTLLQEMHDRNLSRGVAALCVGGGQGAAILLERE